MVNLRERDLRREGRLIAEGSFLVERLLETDLAIENIWCTPSHYEKYGKDGLPFTVLSAKEISRLAGYPFHRGVIAQARAPETEALPPEGVLPDRGILVLPRLGDPENLGGLLRTALGLGIRTVFLGPGNPWEYGRKALRSAMGAQFRLNLYSYDSPAELFRWNGAKRTVIASALERDSAVLDDFPVSEKWLLLMGHEGDGLDRDYLERADAKLIIPQSAAVDSLNVNVAAGILLYRLLGSPPA